MDGLCLCLASLQSEWLSGCFLAADIMYPSRNYFQPKWRMLFLQTQSVCKRDEMARLIFKNTIIVFLNDCWLPEPVEKQEECLETAASE